LTNLRPRLRGPDRTSLARRVGLLTATNTNGSEPPPAKIFLKPRWLALHLFIAAIAVAMVLLGRWQLHVSNAKHFDLQNFGYAVQWWTFSAFAVLLWARIIRDTRRPPASKRTESHLVVPTGPSHSDGAAHVGPADLVAFSEDPDEAPVVYRGYVPPQSATTTPHSEGDRFHASYNDYLWQLALADTSGQIQPPPASMLDPQQIDPRAITTDPGKPSG
jgi:DNA-binding transcriptional regulator of glucitol operon